MKNYGLWHGLISTESDQASKSLLYVFTELPLDTFQLDTLEMWALVLHLDTAHNHDYWKTLIKKIFVVTFLTLPLFEIQTCMISILP